MSSKESPQGNFFKTLESINFQANAIYGFLRTNTAIATYLRRSRKRGNIIIRKKQSALGRFYKGNPKAGLAGLKQNSRYPELARKCWRRDSINL